AAWLGITARERLTTRQWAGLGLGLVGVVLVVRTDSADVTGTMLLGNLLALGSAVTWAWYGLTIGPLARSMGPVGATATTLALAALVLTPFGVVEVLSVDWAAVSPSAWAGLLYGSLFGLVLATLLWVRSIQRWG